jgi:hypothetical protein
VINQPFYFDAVFAVLKPFLKDKIRRRVRKGSIDILRLDSTMICSLPLSDESRRVVPPRTSCFMLLSGLRDMKMYLVHSVLMSTPTSSSLFPADPILEHRASVKHFVS